MRSGKAATAKTGRTVSGKRSLGVDRNDFPSQRDSKTFPRRLSVCVEFHGGHDGRIAKAERPSAASPNFSQLSARGSPLYPIQKNLVIDTYMDRETRGLGGGEKKGLRSRCNCSTCRFALRRNCSAAHHCRYTERSGCFPGGSECIVHTSWMQRVS